MEPVSVAVVILATGLILYYFIRGQNVVDPSTRPQAPDSQIDAIALAINKQENSPPAWNNPGDLTGADGDGFANLGPQNSAGVLAFASTDDGWNALYRKLLRIQNGESTVYPLSHTIRQMGVTWSGGDQHWGPNVASLLGVSADDPISAMFGE